LTIFDHFCHTHVCIKLWGKSKKNILKKKQKMKKNIFDFGRKNKGTDDGYGFVPRKTKFHNLYAAGVDFT